MEAIDTIVILRIKRGYNYNVTDLIIVVVILLERDVNRLVVEVREVLELVEL
jgi:hypothetical protein